MGQSFGKRFLKIKVLIQDAESPELHNIIIRHLFDVTDFAFLPRCIVVFTNKRRQRIGDLMAKTMVMQK
ncbi:MAG: RDD family protein [Saprospiraceae bacterium]|uniref:RDD family protein n=1 Tax=Candidatus Defluviibacterium haderslevense TaxID=2981993 RepID=A0A9D7XDS1_9BACT|nr:RDD family protein [Candidatus Defluviibacterium haderslevense]